MSIDRTSFCELLNRFNARKPPADLALIAQLSGLNALGALMKLARDVKRVTTAPLVIPIDAQAYYDLLLACEGLLPPLPTSAGEAATAIALLNELVNGTSPATILNQISADPQARLALLQRDLHAVFSAAADINPISLVVRGKSEITEQLKNEARKVATAAAANALAKLGVSLTALQRCLREVCRQ